MASSDAGTTVKYYPEEEVAALVRSLDRPQDNQLFSVDVLITYPSLAEQYVRVCPHRCDLTTATQKALDGDYSHDQRLESLKADVQLMVSNCVRFNGDDHPLSEMAADFEKFAMQKIEHYLTGKMGGRRVSSLRVQQQLSQVPSTPPPTGGKPGQKGTSVVAAAKAGSSSSAHLHARHKELSKADLVSLIKGLVRREDAGAFEVDVAEVYPELKENYEKVCPTKMNLVLMREKAEKGVYNTSLSAIGASVADSLTDVRTDIELIVNNCIRFNSQLPDWVRLAETFRKFAHRRVDDLVLRVAPSLRNTKTGTQVYASSTAASAALAGAAPVASSQEVIQVSSDSASTTVNGSAASTTPSATAVAVTPGSKRPRPQDDEQARKTIQWANAKANAAAAAAAAAAADYAGPTVKVVDTVAPSVCPTPLQPAVEVPERLRRRLVADHVGRDKLRARLTGRTAAFIQVFPPEPPAKRVEAPVKADKAESEPVTEAKPATDEQQEGEEGVAPVTSEAGTETTAVASQPTASESDANKATATIDSKGDAGTAAATAAEASSVAVLQPPRADWPITLTPDQSARAVLDSFRASIHRFYDEKRHTSDFNDPFQYSLQDEALYVKMLDTVEEQLESVFLGTMLYAQEAADVHEWVALEALKRPEMARAEPTVAAQDSGEAAPAGHANAAVVWAPAIHYTYLVRFLVQLPQMAALSSATLSAPANAQAAPVVKVSREALAVLNRLTQFTSEFLAFIAEYEETLLGSADMTKQLSKPNPTE